MTDNQRSRLKQLLATGKARLHPLSFPQRELWEASALAPTDVSNHICTSIKVRGPISPDDALHDVQKLVDRQDVFRTSILPGKDRPLQLVRSNGGPNVVDRKIANDPAELDRAMRQVFARPFDLVRGPLYRIEILRVAPDELYLVFAIHHAIADGWSLGVLVQDLSTAHLQKMIGQSGDLPAVPLTYADWAAAERDYWQPTRLRRCADYWKQHLAGAPRLWPAAGPGVPRRLIRIRKTIPASTTRRLQSLARKADATLFSTLLAGFQLSLAGWANATDIVVGTPVANRTKQSARETIGYFAGNVPLRGRIDPNSPVLETVRNAHATAMDAFAHAMPFAELVKAIGDLPRPDHNPVFDVRFALQNHPIPDVDVPGLSLKLRMHATGTARFDLGCELTEDGDELEQVWLYREKMFSPADIEALSTLFQTTLDRMSE